MELFVDDLFVGCLDLQSRTQGAVVLFILSNAKCLCIWGLCFNPLLSRWNWIPSPFAMPFVPVPKGKHGSRWAQQFESLGHGDSICSSINLERATSISTGRLLTLLVSHHHLTSIGDPFINNTSLNWKVAVCQYPKRRVNIVTSLPNTFQGLLSCFQLPGSIWTVERYWTYGIWWRIDLLVKIPFCAAPPSTHVSLSF